MVRLALSRLVNPLRNQRLHRAVVICIEWVAPHKVAHGLQLFLTYALVPGTALIDIARMAAVLPDALGAGVADGCVRLKDSL